MALPFAIFIGWECLGGIPLGCGIVVEDKPSEFSCSPQTVIIIPVKWSIIKLLGNYVYKQGEADLYNHHSMQSVPTAW